MTRPASLIAQLAAVKPQHSVTCERRQQTRICRRRCVGLDTIRGGAGVEAAFHAAPPTRTAMARSLLFFVALAVFASAVSTVAITS